MRALCKKGAPAPWGEITTRCTHACARKMCHPCPCPMHAHVWLGQCVARGHERRRRRRRSLPRFRLNAHTHARTHSFSSLAVYARRAHALACVCVRIYIGRNAPRRSAFACTNKSTRIRFRRCRRGTVARHGRARARAR